MKSVLVISWSQTGQSHNVAESFVRGLDRRLFDVTVERLRPRVPFPFPWTIGKFFGVMPECVLGRPAEVEQPAFAPDARFDLIKTTLFGFPPPSQCDLDCVDRSPMARGRR